MSNLQSNIKPPNIIEHSQTRIVLVKTVSGPPATPPTKGVTEIVETGETLVFDGPEFPLATEDSTEAGDSTDADNSTDSDDSTDADGFIETGDSPKVDDLNAPEVSVIWLGDAEAADAKTKAPSEVGETVGSGSGETVIVIVPAPGVHFSHGEVIVEVAVTTELVPEHNVTVV